MTVSPRRRLPTLKPCWLLGDMYDVTNPRQTGGKVPIAETNNCCLWFRLLLPMELDLRSSRGPTIYRQVTTRSPYKVIFSCGNGSGSRSLFIACHRKSPWRRY